MELKNIDLLYRKMVEEIEDYAILLLSAKGMVLNWNKGAEKIKGYKAKDIIGKNFDTFYTEEDRKNKLPEKLLKTAFLKGKASAEGWRLRKNKSRFWGSVLITAIHDESKKVIGFTKVTRDLSKHKEAEETEKKLSQATVGLTTIFNASNTAMALTDIESRKFVQVNESFLSTFGFKRKEVLSYDAVDLGIVPEATRKLLADNLAKQAYLKNEEVLCFTKHKKEINCILSADLFNMEGKNYFLSVFQDISHVKEMERKARESEEKFHKAFEASGAGIAITNISNSKYLEVNDTFVKMTGYSKKQLIGHTSLELGLIVNIEQRNEILNRVKVHGSAKHFVLSIRNRSGKIIDILSTVDSIEINKEKYAINTIYDISERIKTEEKLGHLAAIVEYSDDAIISKTLEGTIKSWNKGAEVMFGYPAKEVIGKNISLIVPSEYINEEIAILEKLCNNELMEHYETVRLKKDGKPLQVSITVSPLKNKEGKIVAASKIIRDISERKRAEDSGKLKDAFLSIISHEIRTPLNAIMGFSDVLLKRKLPEAEYEYVGIIKTAGENLLMILNDTIDMSKIEAGTMSFVETNFKVQDVLKTVATIQGPRAKNKDLQLHCNSDKNMPLLLTGDQKRLEQILLNLTNNAINFTDEGTIDVKAEVISHRSGSTSIEFSVTDTGRGISKDQLKTIFDRFKQTEDPVNRNQGGLGLGLSIAKHLVELQGGSFRVGSELGVGSTFSFIIPFKNAY